MDPNQGVYYMAAEIEHRLIVERASEPWRVAVAGHRRRGIGLIARLRSLVTRTGGAVQDRVPTTASALPIRESGSAAAGD